MFYVISGEDIIFVGTDLTVGKITKSDLGISSASSLSHVCVKQFYRDFRYTPHCWLISLIDSQYYFFHLEDKQLKLKLNIHDALNGVEIRSTYYYPTNAPYEFRICVNGTIDILVGDKSYVVINSPP